MPILPKGTLYREQIVIQLVRRLHSFIMSSDPIHLKSRLKERQWQQQLGIVGSYFPSLLSLDTWVQQQIGSNPATHI